jgi:hypothetical protein
MIACLVGAMTFHAIMTIWLALVVREQREQLRKFQKSEDRCKAVGPNGIRCTRSAEHVIFEAIPLHDERERD